MTRRTNAKIAGFTFLAYIAVAFPAMVLFDKSTRGESIAARLANIAQHTTEMRITVALGLLWLGVLGSALIALILPMQLTGSIAGPVTNLMWIPVALFEVTLALWLLIKGVAPSARRQSA